jgi:hypothetical protein
MFYYVNLKMGFTFWLLKSAQQAFKKAPRVPIYL